MHLKIICLILWENNTFCIKFLRGNLSILHSEEQDNSLENIIIKSFLPNSVQVKVESNGNKSSMIVISDAFVGKTRIQRHQMVYKALGDALDVNTGFMHALQIETRTYDEM